MIPSSLLEKIGRQIDFSAFARSGDPAGKLYTLLEAIRGVKVIRIDRSGDRVNLHSVEFGYTDEGGSYCEFSITYKHLQEQVKNLTSL